MIVSRTKGHGRGGVALVVKCKLETKITNVDLSTQDQIWFRIQNIPRVLFGGVYIPPSNSDFFDPSSVAAIQARQQNNPDDLLVCLGDINTRFGDSLQSLVSDDVGMSYRPVDMQSNPRGKDFIQLCRDCKMLPVNNLEITNGNGGTTRFFETGLTFRKRERWISEVDFCLVARKLIPTVVSASVNQSYSFPSDHAPVSVVFEFPTNIPTPAAIQERAQAFGRAEPAQISKRHPMQKKAIRKQAVDRENFVEAMSRIQPPHLLNTAEEAAQAMCDIMYKAANDSKVPPPPPPAEQEDAPTETHRWQRIIESKDPKALWKAINWKGEVSISGRAEDEKPTDEAFKEHMERLLNPPETPLLTRDVSSMTCMSPH